MTESSKSKSKGTGLISRLKAKFRPPTPDLDLTGKTALVTGTTSGLGLEACRQLLSHGVSQLIMSARTEAKGEARAAELRLLYPNADIQVWVLEMEAYDSVIAFAERAMIDLDRLDMVILNAGALEPYATPSKYTGHEKMFQVNYLSTALLARLLIPVLRIVPPENEPSRLTIVTPDAYKPYDYVSEPPTFACMDSTRLPAKASDPGFRYMWKRFAKPRIFLQPYLSRVITGVNPNEVTINFVVPGLVKDTQLTDKLMHMSRSRRKAKLAYALIGKSLEKGAAGYIDAVAVKGIESHGETIMFRQIRHADYRYPPLEWYEFEDDLWEDTENEFRRVFNRSKTLGAKIYSAGLDD